MHAKACKRQKTQKLENGSCRYTTFISVTFGISGNNIIYRISDNKNYN